MIIVEGEDRRFVRARGNLRELKRAEQQKLDLENSALRIKRILVQDLWKNYAYLGAIASGFFLVGAIAGHNMMSAAVLCESGVCELLRFDGNEVRK